MALDAEKRIPDTTLPANSFKDGDILYGSDMNRVVDTLKTAVNENYKDLKGAVKGGDSIYINPIEGVVDSEGQPIDTVDGLIKWLYDNKILNEGKIYSLRINDSKQFEYYDGESWKIATVGQQGEPGEGVPAGGLSGQFLRKQSDVSYDTEWVDAYDKPQVDIKINNLTTRISTNTNDIARLNKFSIITLGTSWTQDITNGYYTQTVSLSGITSNDNPIIDIVLSNTLEEMQTQQEEWSKILKVETSDDGLTFYASEATTNALNLILKMSAVTKSDANDIQNEVNELKGDLVEYVGKGSINLYDKRDLTWIIPGYDLVPFDLKAGKYIVSFVSSGTDNTLTFELFLGSSIKYQKTLNNADFNTRNSFDIELSSDINVLRIWNDSACTISDIMIVPKNFGNQNYKKCIPTNEEISKIVDYNFNYIDKFVIDKIDTDYGKLVKVNASESGEYGYSFADKYNETSLYPAGGSSNAHGIFDVSFNEHYKVSLYTPTSYSMCEVLFTDNDLIVIDYLRKKQTSTLVEYDFKIPYGATKMLLSFTVGSNYPISVKKYEYETLENRINEIIEPQIENLKNDYPNIPSYYVEHINSKINEIHTLEEKIGMSGDVVAFITDTHRPSNTMNSPYLLEKIRDCTTLKYLIDGGDICNGNDSIINTPDVCKKEMYDIVNAFEKSFGTNVIRAFGNHDKNAYGSAYQGQEALTDNENYSIMFKRQQNIVVTDSNNYMGRYFYFDNEEQKIRHIILNTDESSPRHGFSVACITWLRDVALVFPSSGWSVAFYCHQPISSNMSYRYFRAIIRALNNGTTYSFTDTEIEGATYNFSFDFTGDKQADVLYVMNGHEHQDKMYVSDGVVHVWVTSDACYNDDYEHLGYRRTSGTIYEQAFDVVCINKNTKHVDIVRVGAGFNRGFTYGENPSIDE